MSSTLKLENSSDIPIVFHKGHIFLMGSNNFGHDFRSSKLGHMKIHNVSFLGLP